MDAFGEFVGSWTFILILLALMVTIMIAGPLAIILILIRVASNKERSDHDS